MKKLIKGIVDFRKNLTQEYRDLFSKLAIEQKPDSLFIACSDSRVVPNLFASTEPGDLFVLRNVGNLVPSFEVSNEENSASATLEFSIFYLNVKDIVVCGHSECGAMKALIHGIENLDCPHLKAWLKNGEATLDMYRDRDDLIMDKSLVLHNQISQLNVLKQMDHIASYPFVKERMHKNELHLHGFWFDIARADVYAYEPTLKKFVLIDENEAKLIIKRIG